MQKKTLVNNKLRLVYAPHGEDYKGTYFFINRFLYFLKVIKILNN